MRTALLRLFGATCLFIGAACSDQQAVSDASVMAAQDLNAQIQAETAPLIVDVRSSSEFASGHIPGAINIPHTEIAERIAELGSPGTTEIVVHCERGGRAAEAERILSQAGYTNFRDLTGHMKGWREAGFPVHKDDS